jgi:hypothetical protein
MLASDAQTHSLYHSLSLIGPRHPLFKHVFWLPVVQVTVKKTCSSFYPAPLPRETLHHFCRNHHLQPIKLKYIYPSLTLPFPTFHSIFNYYFSVSFLLFWDFQFYIVWICVCDDPIPLQSPPSKVTTSFVIINSWVTVVTGFLKRRWRFRWWWLEFQ